jgi:hypothetical protein
VLCNVINSTIITWDEIVNNLPIVGDILYNNDLLNHFTIHKGIVVTDLVRTTIPQTTEIGIQVILVVRL